MTTDNGNTSLPTLAATIESLLFVADAPATVSQLAEAGIEVLLGGGACYFIPEGTTVREHSELAGIHRELDDTSRRTDGNDLIAAMKKRGYSIVSTRDELIAVGSSAVKLIGLFADKL